MLQIAVALWFSLSSASLEQQAGDVMRNIWSPYCKGVSLLECPSGQAETLREEVIARLKQGEDPEAIRGDLLNRYGDMLRMQPSFEGRESLAWIIPWLLFALGILFVIFFWWRRSKSAPPSDAPRRPSANLSPDLQAEIRERMD